MRRQTVVEAAIRCKAQRGRVFVSCALLLVVIGGACRKQAPVHRIERIDGKIARGVDIALAPAEFVQSIQEKLRAHGRFVLPPDSAGKPGARVVFTLAAIDTRDAPQAAVVVEIRRARSESYELEAMGQVSGPVAQAVAVALDAAVASTHAYLSALEKSDRALVADLGSKNVHVREHAVRVLAARGRPEAAAAYVDDLKSEDPAAVRRAIGGLVELHDPRGVPALIDLARGKDLGFMREIVFALGEIGGDEAQAYLYTVSQGHDSPEIRDAASEALEAISSRRTRKAHSRTDEENKP